MLATRLPATPETPATTSLLLGTSALSTRHELNRAAGAVYALGLTAHTIGRLFVGGVYW